MEKVYSIVKISIDRKTKSKLNAMKFEHGFETMEDLYATVFKKGMTHMRELKKKAEVRKKIKENKT